MPQYVACHAPHMFHSHSTLLSRPSAHSVAATASAVRNVVDYVAQLEALLREHEPHKVHQARDLLRLYAGMERELIQCYRHHYTGDGGFCVAARPPTTSTATVFSLPRAAIATYLRELLLARRSRGSATPTSASAKGDDVRSPELLLQVLPSSTNQRIEPSAVTRNRNALVAPSSSILTPPNDVRAATAVAVAPMHRSCAVRPMPLRLCAASRAPASASSTSAASAAVTPVRRH